MSCQQGLSTKMNRKAQAPNRSCSCNAHEQNANCLINDISVLKLEKDWISMFDQLPLSRHINASHSSGINEFHFSHFVDVPSPNLKGRVQTLKAKHSQRHSPTHFLIIFCFGCGLACDCKNARTEKRHLQHLRKQLLDTHLARRFNSVGTLCPSCLWGIWTKLNHL